MNNKEKDRVYRKIIPGKTRVYYLVEEYCQWHTFQEIFKSGPIDRAPLLRSGIVYRKSRNMDYFNNHIDRSVMNLSIRGAHKIRIKPEHIYFNKQEAIKEYKKYMNQHIRYLNNEIERHHIRIEHLQNKISRCQTNIKRKKSEPKG